MDKLDEIFQLQKSYASAMTLDRYPRSKELRVSALCTAIVHEAVELQRLTSWKWWKKPSRFNVLKAKEELVDIWHFMIQVAIELEMTPDELLDEYRNKNMINRKRQEEGY